MKEQKPKQLIYLAYKFRNSFKLFNICKLILYRYFKYKKKKIKW
jgi:hypothetical protein